jgi:quercetin dioxygenase-like cupin family protein
MTFHNGNANLAPAILTPETQRAVWFLGAVTRIRAGGHATGQQLAVLDHQAERGYGSPVHRHLAEDETFLVLEGELRIEVDGQVCAAGPGAAAFLPRRLPHAFVVTSPQARFMTIHTPGGFDEFVLAASTSIDSSTVSAAGEPPPDLAALSAVAASYGIEILGPPPIP